MKTLTADICIIGAGSGGLSVAAVASQLDLRVIVIEERKDGRGLPELKRWFLF